MALLNEIIRNLIQNYGLVAIFIIIFSETGLLVGFFFPGDTLLFLAGIYAGNGTLNIWALIIVAALAAILGDSVGYFIGYKTGPRLFKKDDSIFFNKHHLTATQNFYERHGGKTVIIARFVGLLRTFAPVAAGAGKMKYATFVSYNIVGGILWVSLLSLLGYFLGSKFEWLIQIADLGLLGVTIGSILLAFTSVGYKLFEKRYVEFYDHPTRPGKKKRKINFQKPRKSK